MIRLVPLIAQRIKRAGEEDRCLNKECEHTIDSRVGRNDL